MYRKALRTCRAAFVVAVACAAVACGDARDAERIDATPTATADSPGRTPSPPPRATATPIAPSATPAADAPAPMPDASSVPTAAPCVGHCPTGFLTPTPATIGDDDVPRVPALRALTFSSGDTLTASDLYVRGAGTPGRGPFTGASLVIPSIGVDAAIESQTVGASGVMPEPSSYGMVAWYDFAGFGGLGGIPLLGGNVVLAGNLGGVFAHLGGVVPGEILVLHLIDGRRLFYRVEFNKTAAVDGTDWEALAAATADESMTVITATGANQGGGTYTHRRIVWARRVNCGLLESPVTPTRAPYVECEVPA